MHIIPFIYSSITISELKAQLFKTFEQQAKNAHYMFSVVFLEGAFKVY